MKSSFIVYSTFAGLAAAQTLSVDNFPQCARTCYPPAVRASGCSSADTSCICNSEPYLESITPCLYSNCGSADISEFLSFSVQACARAAGITDPIPSVVPTDLLSYTPSPTRAPLPITSSTGGEEPATDITTSSPPSESTDEPEPEPTTESEESDSSATIAPGLTTTPTPTLIATYESTSSAIGSFVSDVVTDAEPTLSASYPGLGGGNATYQIPTATIPSVSVPVGTISTATRPSVPSGSTVPPPAENGGRAMYSGVNGLNALLGFIGAMGFMLV